MKHLLLVILATFTFASADMLPPSEASSELTFIATSDYECNLYIELAGTDLLALTQAEKQSNPKAIQQAFNSFMQHSSRAITICSYVNELAVSDIVNIQNSISHYYYKHYK
jgi:hypothetical protein